MLLRVLKKNISHIRQRFFFVWILQKVALKKLTKAIKYHDFIKFYYHLGQIDFIQ